MSEERFEVDGVEVERFMLVFGDDGTRIVDNKNGKELYGIDVVALLNSLLKKNEQLRQKLECCEYKHFKKELDKIHEKVEKGDLNDFCTLTISDKGLEHWNGVLK